MQLYRLFFRDQMPVSSFWLGFEMFVAVVFVSVVGNMIGRFLTFVGSNS